MLITQAGNADIGATIVFQSVSLADLLAAHSVWHDATVKEGRELDNGLYVLAVGNEYIDWCHFRSTGELLPTWREKIAYR